jgi:hypothetical protein
MSEKSAQILKDYLFEKRWKVCDFAIACHICRFSVFKYLKGSPIRKSIAERIEKVTNKEIRIHQLIE